MKAEEDSQSVPLRILRAPVLLLGKRSLTLLNYKMSNQTPMVVRENLRPMGKDGAGKEDGAGKAWVWEPRTCLPGPLSAAPQPHSCPSLNFALHHWSTSLMKAGTLHAVWSFPTPLNGAEHVVGAY